MNQLIDDLLMMARQGQVVDEFETIAGALAVSVPVHTNRTRPLWCTRHSLQHGPLTDARSASGRGGIAFRATGRGYRRRAPDRALLFTVGA
jgi:hypothetical protein